MQKHLGTFLLFLSSFLTISAYGQGYLWGVTLGGGKDNAGVIFKTKVDGSDYTIVKEFEVQYPGQDPTYNALCKASDGKLYGVTMRGGKFDSGVLFSYDPITGNYSKKVDFKFETFGFSPTGTLVEVNEKLYGTTSGGRGTIFSYDLATEMVSKEFTFNLPINGEQPYGGLALADNGKLYGMTEVGGINSVGVVFEFDPATQAFTKLKDLIYETGCLPHGALTFSDGLLYGLTKSGGNNGAGVLFTLNPDTKEYLKRADFSYSTTGSKPFGSVVKGANGKYYGMTSDGGAFANGIANVDGTLFEYDPATDILDKKHDFAYYGLGGDPFGSLMLASNGKLYGMTSIGGLGGNSGQVGVLFEYSTEDGMIPKHYFDWPMGGTPYGTLTEVDGNLYGMTFIGGLHYDGVLFEYNIAEDRYQKKLDFGNGLEGMTPMGGLTFVGEKLYGVTSVGGAFGEGTIFEYDTTTHTFLKRYDFSLKNDSANYPAGKLTLGSNGKLYGFLEQSIVNGFGAIYEFDPVEGIVVKKFDMADLGGSSPIRNLVSSNIPGKLYGVTYFGGLNNQGILFEFDYLNNTFTKKVTFNPAVDGGEPVCQLIEGPDNTLYGFTRKGGTNNTGTIYAYNPSTGVLTKKLNLPGTGIYETFTYGGENKFYGLAHGYPNISGLIFEYNLSDNVLKNLYEIDPENGAYQNGLNVAVTPDGQVYGMTSSGGSYQQGVIFRFDLLTQSYTVTHHFDTDSGGLPSWSDLLFVPTIVTNAEENVIGRIVTYPNPS
ncbi:MAG TPA: hypothetical protein PLJ60_12805, partial [Chryseolinea sp.]|nr:hypothetical protein [Chryseolinea sp.]